MAGRLDKPLPFCLFLRALALRERSENCRAVPDPKSACSGKKLDRQSNSTEAIARRRPHASVSRASQAGENKGQGTRARTLRFAPAPPVDGASGKKGE